MISLWRSEKKRTENEEEVSPLKDWTVLMISHSEKLSPATSYNSISDFYRVSHK